MLRELTGALLLLFVSIGYYAAASGINASALGDEVGAAGLPVVYAVSLGTIALALAIKALISSRLPGAGRGGEDSNGHGRRLARAAGMLVIGVGYVAIVSAAGYLLSLLAVIVLVALYQGERISLRLAGIALGGAVLFFVFFDLLLGIDMPTGIWRALAGS